MEEPEQDIRETLAGENEQGMNVNPHLSTDPCNGKTDTTVGPALVLKVRIQNSKENDFIEIELHRQELSYQNLLHVSCCELGIHPEQVEKIREAAKHAAQKGQRHSKTPRLSGARALGEEREV